ncbi:MAG: hypothetical protein ABI847_05330 [Anaerolineales bacterium]
MLEHLRQRVIETLAGVRTVTLTTSGSAGLQAGHLPCQALGTLLYVLVPRASDHLFNLETQPEVVVVDEIWNLKGRAQLAALAVWPPRLRQHPDAKRCEVIEIHPSRLSLLCRETGSPIETIDVD